ncbi:hypothetical protein UT300012_24040 [Paraclostridium bifermentans]
MNLFILLMTGYHLYNYDKVQISVSSYMQMAMLLLAVSILITFIMGIIIVSREIESEWIWFIFKGFDYDAESIGEYLYFNAYKLIVWEGAIVSALMIAKKII